MEITDGQETVEPTLPTDWRELYINWLAHQKLPTNKTDARRTARRAKSFIVINDELYKRSARGVLQRCIPVEQGQALLRDIHASVRGHHAASKTLVGNAFRQGFYWPTALADTASIVRSCKGC